MNIPDSRLAISVFTGFSQVGAISVLVFFDDSQPPQYSNVPNKVMYSISMVMTILLNVTLLNSLRMIILVLKVTL